MVTCDWCGKDFPADPRAFSESGFSMFLQEEEDPAESWKGEDASLINLKDVAPEEISEEFKQAMKEQMGLDDDQLAELLSTGHVSNGYSCVCLQCQDEAIPAEE